MTQTTAPQRDITGTIRRAVHWSATPAGLATLFASGLILRLALTPLRGYPDDIRLFTDWAHRLLVDGPSGFYPGPGNEFFVDYPPGYLYVLWGLAHIGDLFGSSFVSPFMLKVPPIIGDLALAWVLVRLVDVLKGDRRSPERALAAAMILFGPPILFVSAVWGQVDSVAVALIAGAVLLFADGEPSVPRSAAGVVLCAAAVLAKPQSLLVMVTLALLFWWCQLRPQQGRVARLVAAIAAGTATVLLAIVPFGLTPVTVIPFYRGAAGEYPFTSVFAFSLWGSLGFGRPDSGPDAVTVLGIPIFFVAASLFAAGLLVIVGWTWRSLRRGEHPVVVAIASCAASVALSFAVLTRLHERYVFPAVALLAFLVVMRRVRWWIAAALSVLFFLNLFYAYAYRVSQLGPTLGLPLIDRLVFGRGTVYRTSFMSWQLRVLCVLTAVACIVVAVRALWPERLPSLSAAAFPKRFRGVDWERTLPRVLVGAAVVFGLLALRHELIAVQNLNDADVHRGMIRWARQRIVDGHLPFDGWFPIFGLGSPHFHHYQSLAHIVAGYLAVPFGVVRTHLWTLYLGVALWPLCVYVSGRLFRFSRMQAACAAFLAPLLASVGGLGFEHGAYTWRGYGTWAQLWGMWLLPVVLGLCFRALTDGRGYALASASLAVLMATHFLTGWLALASIGLWLFLRRHDVIARGRRLVLLYGTAFVIGSWAMVPLLWDFRYSVQNEFLQGDFRGDGYGLGKVVAWLFSGELFDSGLAVPIVTVFAAIGAVVFVSRMRTHDNEKAILYVFVLGVVLYAGRPTFGVLIDLLPVVRDLELNRYISGIHFAGVLAAGVGAERAGRWLVAREGAGRHIRGVVLAGVGIAVVAAFAARWEYNSYGAGLMASQRATDAAEGRDVHALIQRAEGLGGGRIYAGSRANWGSDYRVGYVPVLAMLSDEDADGVGYTLRTSSMMTTIEARFDETNPAHYDLFNVRYLLLPTGREPSVEARLVEQRGRHRLFQVPTRGYVSIVDVDGVIEADRKNIGTRMESFLRSDLPARHVHPSVAFGGRDPAPSTLRGTRSSPGWVERQEAFPFQGVFTSDVVLTRRAMVMLKASFHPRWRVLVDGRPLEPQMVAPAYVGRIVEPGRHIVAFRYEGFPYYGHLLALGALVLVTLWLVERRRSS